MKRFLLAVVLVPMTLSACASPSPAPSTSERPAETSGPKTLTLAVAGEPANLALSLSQGNRSIGASNEIGLAVHQWLAVYDEQGAVRPMLAAELPSRDRGTWVIRPDGTMQTTYRLRPGVTWHDGAPLRATDFVFARAVAMDPDIPGTTSLAMRQIESMDAPEDLTLIIEWRNTYPFASELVESSAAPLPSHLLAASYGTLSIEQFLQLPYWTRSFTGVGPFELAEWEPGSHMVLKAYDRFYSGRAHLDRLVVRFIGDPNTAMANLLSGAVDGVTSGTIEIAQAALVTKEWETAGRKPAVFLSAVNWRHLFAQFRNPRHPELLDVRVRRGLLHAIDRQAVVDTVLEGRAPISYASIPPDDPKWSWIEDVVVRYDYDPRRAQQLLSEAGWLRIGDTSVVNHAGERVALGLSTTASAQGEQTITIVGDQWKAIGLSVELSTLGATQARDLRVRASFPGFWLAGFDISWDGQLRRVSGRECPTEASRWVGSSLGCYQNAEMDRIIDGLAVEIDRAEQRLLWRELARLQSEELPVLPLFFSVFVTLFRDGVTGVRGPSKPTTRATWNTAEWDLAS